MSTSTIEQATLPCVSEFCNVLSLNPGVLMASQEIQNKHSVESRFLGDFRLPMLCAHLKFLISVVILGEGKTLLHENYAFVTINMTLLNPTKFSYAMWQ